MRTPAPQKPQLAEDQQEALLSLLEEVVGTCNAVDDLAAGSPHPTDDDYYERVGDIVADEVVTKTGVQLVLEDWERQPDAVMSTGEPASEHMQKLASLLTGGNDVLAGRIDRSLKFHE